ncbi:linear amide C-N hydrolase [Shewanella alkalitolerans]|uniref:linear amide C-N hydrolase n=1 Tax=Shewanella alkalitolerans TaxID=2864209 RepID=UPI001C65DD32|nr:linear amide C-N hydrolase [Shewanella alkalitolerans]QYJ96715.1 linear amide C-N hydrolase [Shewanella alkalitolerans]
MKKSIVAASIVALMTIGAVQTASACSSVSATTDYGTLVARSLDWDVHVEARAKIIPAGVEISSKAPSYKTQATWTTKYKTMSLSDNPIFHGTAYDAINDQGLSVHGQYQEASKPFLTMHKDNDNGAPAVNNGLLATYITSNYKTVAEAIDGLDKGEWQPAFSDPLMDMDHLVPAHFNLRDNEGNVALIQLNAGGKLKVWRGSTNDELRFVTNEPLFQDHLEFSKTIDRSALGTKLPADYSPLSRYVRGLHHAESQDFKNMTYQQTMAAQLLAFHSAVAIPQSVQAPFVDGPKIAEEGGVFPTFFTVQYNLKNGDTVYSDLYEGHQIKFNFAEVSVGKEPVCANLSVDAHEGRAAPTFGKCS